MHFDSTIIVTGAAGFIGSCLAGYLNVKGYTKLILVDDFSRADKENNLKGKKFLLKVEREELGEWLKNNKAADFVFHIGARTDTTEFDYSIHERLNLEYSKMIWEYCASQDIPMVYASSAATYGDGSAGYDDDHAIVNKLTPLNPYGLSKHEFDKWALAQVSAPPSWAGLKFFNVYGPNEYHKGRMASVIFHAVNQVKEMGVIRLFRSHKEGFQDGEQLRDFIYVKDVLDVCYWLFEHQGNFENGLYNLGTGKARSFKDLALATFKAMDKEPVIEFFDMPGDIRETYQYFTEAKMDKLRNAGYVKSFYSLEEGASDYVRNYLINRKFY